MTDQEILARAITLAMGPEHELVDRLAAVLRKHDDEHYKLSWQVRDTCARAEAAEAERDTLLAQVEKMRGVLTEIAESDDIDNALDPERNKRLARAALTKEPS